jgi:hypothetical protein
VKRGGLWAKHMGLKQVAIGNTLGNTLGTSLNLRNLGNPLGTCWEQRKDEKISPPNLKEKNQGTLNAC